MVNDNLQDVDECPTVVHVVAMAGLPHLEPDAIAERIESLVGDGYTQYGPNYNRGVVEALADARQRLDRSAAHPPNLAAAHAAVLEAEVAAGRRPVDDLAAYRNGGWDADVKQLRARSDDKTVR